MPWPGLRCGGSGGSIDEAGNYAFEPMKIDVRDDTAKGETSGGTHAKLPPCGRYQQWGEHDHGAADAVESAGVKVLRGGSLSRVGFGL